MSKNGKEDSVADDDHGAKGKEPFHALDIAELAIHSANAGVWILDTATKNFFTSARTKSLFGFLPDDEMSLNNALSQIVENNRKTAIEAMETAIEERGYLHAEYPVKGYRDHELRWLSVTGGFSETDSASSYFSGIVMDITDQKQNALRRSKFIGMVSHELKTPLTALKAYVQMLNNWARKQKDNFTIGALSKVDKQVRKMLNMINNLLNLSGAESGKIHLNKQEFVLNELISEVIEETVFVAPSHNFILLPSDAVIIDADRDKIEQVLVNLLSNAAKYSDKVAPVQIACVQHGDHVQVSVADEGLGIAQEDIDKLFLPHYRVESKETEKIPGFGIGLYLCSEIIQRHHGKIWVDSQLGKGSTFKFTLPVK